MMTNRSDRGSAKSRRSQRFERDDVIREPACGLHQRQQPCDAARTDPMIWAADEISCAPSSSRRSDHVAIT